MTAFSKALENAIKKKKVTIAELARRTGLSRMHIYRLMRGEQAPALDTAEDIAKVIGMQITITSK